MIHDIITVLDFGGQYTQLIGKAVRRNNVYSEILGFETSIDQILDNRPKGIILSGGPDSVYEKGAPNLSSEFWLAVKTARIPVLGICYGMQLMNSALGGGLVKRDGVNELGEYGETGIDLDTSHILFEGLEDKITGWMSHGDSVDRSRIADGFNPISWSEHHVAAISNDADLLYGVQFHPEVTHTEGGLDIIGNFVHKICKCDFGWTMENYIEECKDYIRETVGKNDVIAFVSGGVDSTFVATVLAQTEGIGRVFPIYIGALMRKYENEEVIESLERAGVENLRFVEAEDRFIDAVKCMKDPEEKRKRIGDLFGKIQQEECERLGLDPDRVFLAQGTLYTDLIESGKGVGKKAANIKSHHNVGCPFIEELKSRGQVVEPNRLIFKDEVREAARKICLPSEICERQPYPGPGLGIRIVSGRKEGVGPFAQLLYTQFYQDNDKVSHIARQYGYEGYVLPIKTVGVQGDARTYERLALLRGSKDWEQLREAAKIIPSEVMGVNRIAFEINHRPLNRRYLTSTVPCTVCRETIDQLKEIDYLGREIMDQYGFNEEISQTIFALLGVDPYKLGKRSVILRGVVTDDFMTVSPIEPIDLTYQQLEQYRQDHGPVRMTWQCLYEISDILKMKCDVGAFMIDITDKPPATTCME
ncbi:MAG: glutamine-hydrolyzing GMP synthase [Candidatus Woesearchaeota archaeon]